MSKVSVIMPVYNTDGKYLKAAADSIKCQTHPDWELILYDDGSDRDCRSYIRKAAAGDDRVRIIRSPGNRGAGHARNACIRAASGAYIAIMDSDDISAPRRLETQADFLDRHPEYAFVGCNAWLIGSQGIWGRRILEERPGKQSFLKTLPFIHPSLMFRREVLEELHGYSEKKRDCRVEDYELLMRLYAAGYQGYNIQEQMFCYREDMDSYKKRKYRYRIDECRMRCRGFRKLGILRGHLRYVLKPLAAGLIPSGIMRMVRRRRYRIR